MPVKFLESKFLPQADFVILGVPLEVTETFRGGVKQAPDEIRKASRSIESYSPFFNRDLKNLQFSDSGNLSLSGKLGPDLNLIEKYISALTAEKKRFVVLGGEHTLTLGIVKGIKKILDEDFQVVIFDAHSDFRDNWQGEKINHATVTRRLREITNKVSVVGARSFYGYEDYSQTIYTSLEDVKERLKRKLPVYLSIDMDVLDAAAAPGVTNPEPDGLSYAQVADFIHFLKDFSVLGMDIVEVSPSFDSSQITSITAAKLAMEGLLAMSFESPR
ncbi:MAG: agmatinase [Candidatus Ratteibacteria bacterium]|nr:agmatinase [Candidatus Ratteibacteria bacterium]